MTDLNKELLPESLLAALGNKFSDKIYDAHYTTEILEGGTVGDVVKLSGEAKTDTAVYPFSIVVKSQRKWDRHGDPDCWRREYEVYKQGFADELPKALRLPHCYLLEEGEGFTRIWMEFIEGKTGNKQLHADELSLAAERLGELQAEFHQIGKRNLPYLRSYPAVRSSFDFWWGRMKEPLGAKIEGFPEELRDMLNDYAGRANVLLASIDNLPLTLCQGDVHHDNLILKEKPGGIDVYLIDWDCAGYGRMGEDAVDVLMEAFVYSDRDVSLLPDFRRRVVEGYCAGAKKGGVDFRMDRELIRNIFALAWGFRIADLYLYYKEEHPKRRCVEILQAMLMEG